MASQGERHYSAKLTANRVKWVITFYKPFDPIFGLRPMSRRLNVTPATLSQIIRGRSWRHLTGIKLKPSSGRRGQKKRYGEDVRKVIRDLYSTGAFSQAQLGLRFHIGQSTVGHIVNEMPDVASFETEDVYA